MLSDEFMDDVERGIRKAFMSMEDELIRSVNELEMSTRCLEPLHRMTETPGEVVITFDLPGVQKENIRLTGTERTITIDATCSRKKVWRQSSSISREFEHFRKTITLPSSVDIRSAKATHKRGILEIRLRKSEEGEEIQIT